MNSLFGLADVDVGRLMLTITFDEGVNIIIDNKVVANIKTSGSSPTKRSHIIITAPKDILILREKLMCLDYQGDLND